jgi:tetratricopeptide (TPR) repeat protein
MTTTREKLVLLLVVSALCLIPETRAEARNPHLERGISLLDNAHDEDALREFEQALTWKKSPPKERATIHLYLGITQFNLLEESQSARHFREAFKLDPRVKLPADASPKLVEFVDRIRAEDSSRSRLAAAAKRVSPEVKPLPLPPPRRAAVPLQDEARPRSTNWPAWITLGVSVAAGGTGLAMGLLARQRADEANDLSIPYDQAQPRRDSAESLALTANILFGVAGAAAVVSGVLFIAGRHKSSPAARVARVRGGAMVHLGGFTW